MANFWSWSEPCSSTDNRISHRKYQYTCISATFLSIDIGLGAADTDICIYLKYMLMCTKWCLQIHRVALLWTTVLSLLLKCTVGYFCSTVIKLNWSIIIKIGKQYYIGLALFIGLATFKMLLNIGYQNIGKMSNQSNTTRHDFRGLFQYVQLCMGSSKVPLVP